MNGGWLAAVLIVWALLCIGWIELQTWFKRRGERCPARDDRGLHQWVWYALPRPPVMGESGGYRVWRQCEQCGLAPDREPGPWWLAAAGSVPIDFATVGHEPDDGSEDPLPGHLPDGSPDPNRPLGAYVDPYPFWRPPHRRRP